MQITRYTDYSLRILMYLANKGETLSTIKEIAQSYQISRNHLMKIVQQLGNKGYLVTIRGKNGGLKLNASPGDINVGRLVRDIEQDLTLVECMGSSNTCVITPVCQLKAVFSEALQAFLSKLDEYTLADLVALKHRTAFIQLLDPG